VIPAQVAEHVPKAPLHAAIAGIAAAAAAGTVPKTAPAAV